MVKTMKIYGVYENDEYQECRYVGTAIEVAKEFKCSRFTIYHSIKRKTKLKAKYIVIELYEEAQSEIYS